MKRVMILLALCAGCAARPQQAVYSTQQPKSTTQPAAKPTGPIVSARDFQQLWTAAEDTAREYGFALDRQDYRGGVITTVPLVSKQFFELWRNDVQTLEDVANSSLATYRRTLRFDIQRRADGTYTAIPNVTIERQVQAETPVTASVYLRNAFRSRRGQPQPYGSREADRGIYLPARYWYVTGDDQVLEESIAKHLSHKL